MKITDMSDLVWNLLDPAPDSTGTRTLDCGCHVAADGDHLDLYLWTDGDTTCNNTPGHTMITDLGRIAGRDEDELDSTELRQMRQHIARYTDGRDDADGVPGRATGSSTGGPRGVVAREIARVQGILDGSAMTTADDRGEMRRILRDAQRLEGELRMYVSALGAMRDGGAVDRYEVVSAMLDTMIWCGDGERDGMLMAVGRLRNILEGTV